MRSLSVSLLGDPQVRHDNSPVTCSSKKAFGLFCFLAYSGGRHARRDLARLFWGGRDIDASRASLRTTLLRLPPVMSDCLLVDREAIQLRAEIELDTRRFIAAASGSDVESLRETVPLYRGSLLAGLEVDATAEFDDWLARERSLLLQTARSAFDRLIALHRDRARADPARGATEREEAMAVARHWLAKEPASETAHRWLMRMLVDAGKRDAAAAQFEACARELAVAFGRTPDAETRAILDAVSGNTSGTLSNRERDHSPFVDPNASLFAPEIAATSFVGRVDELATLERLLSDPACRLLTLHALGGAGKSRLAHALAMQVAPRFEFGATWVALDSVRSPDLLASSIARALDIELAPRELPGKALCTALRAQERLLVLDNFEHLVGSQAIDLVLGLLREAPRIRLLVTSREVLGLQEEWIYEVLGLAVPDRQVEQPGAETYSAVDMFMQRARQAYLGFSPQAEWPHVVGICRMVEGLPLAIELVAAWVRTIPCAELATGIRTELVRATSPHTNRPARHDSLDAVVRTSWALLTLEQQQVLAPLSIFVGGFRQDAAEAVSGASLRVLSSLADKALVRRRTDGRYVLHELIRQFLSAELASNAEAPRQTARRFSAYFAGFLVRQCAQLDGPDEVDAMVALGNEVPNLMASANLWIGPEGEQLDKVAAPLMRFLIERGLTHEALSFSDRVLAMNGDLSPSTRTLLLAHRGRVQAILGDLSASRAAFGSAIEVGRAHRLTYPLGYALVFSLAVRQVLEEFRDVQLQLREIELLVADIDDPIVTFYAHLHSGAMFSSMGRALEGEQHLRRAYDFAIATRAPSLLAATQTVLATCLIRLGRFDESAEHLRLALVHFERVGNHPRVAETLNSLAVLSLWRSRWSDGSEAYRDASRASALFERSGELRMLSAALDTLGQAAAILGKDAEARRSFERSAKIGPPSLASEAEFHLALLELKLGRVEEASSIARRLLESARHHDSDTILRWVVILAAAIALHGDPDNIAPRRWLHALQSEPDLDYELRTRAEEMLGAADASDGGSGATGRIELIAEIGRFFGSRA
jgi:predicted ATPase/DNA-binding SARP family transcriptional activator